MEKKEIWKNIAGFERLYQVSSFGRVKSFYGKKEHILKAQKISHGYLNVILYKDGIKNNWLVHRLVANAFIPNPDNLPMINHKDENKQNNLVSNLEWCDANYNANYGTRNKRMTDKLINGSLSKKVGQYSKDGQLIKIWPSIREAKRNGFNMGNIWSCCQGKIKTHGGFIWQYIEN